MSLKLVDFPPRDAALSVPAALRKLADQIEAGELGDAHNLAWVIDCGDSRVEIGLTGPAPEPGPTAYLLFGLAKRRIENL